MDRVQKATLHQKLCTKVSSTLDDIYHVLDHSNFSGNCPKPRRLILRKVRRKLYLNERERLRQRRKALNNNEYEASAVTNDVRAGGPGDSAEKKQDEWRVHNGNEDNIERNEQRKDQAYEEAIEKLRSLVREKKPEYDKLKDGRTKIVSKSVSFSTSTQ